MTTKTLLALTTLLTSLCTVSCNRNHDQAVFELVHLNEHNEIDTIEFHPKEGLYLVDIVTNQAFGNFYTNLAIIKKGAVHFPIIYRMEKNRNEEDRVSKDFIAFVQQNNYANWGWFRISNGKIMDDLPGMKGLLDSLRNIYPDSVFIKDVNGYIYFYVKGKVINSLNYGNIFTKSKHMNFDDLSYNLYQLKEDSLVAISGNADDIFGKKEGVFFIPSPGYGLIAKFDKQAIFNTIDSASKLKDPPSKISIRSIK